MKDIHSQMKIVQLLGPIVMSADATSAALDLGDYQSCELVFGVGIGGITFSDSNKIEFVVTDSDDDATYANVETADVLGVDTVTDGIVKALTAAHAAAAVYRLGYKGAGKFLKVKADFSGTHGTGTPIAVFAILSNGINMPEADQI